MSSSSKSSPESTPGAVSKYLAGLPSRGLFSSTVTSSNLGGMRVYTCDHDTSPPENQLIKTDQMNILIRSLMLKKTKNESNSKDAKGTVSTEGSRKRPSERVETDNKTAKKKSITNAQASSGEGVSKSGGGGVDKDLQRLTVERLRALLREKGLSQKGRKDELIARLRAANNS
ncbi:uncharacterized protein LOC124913839 [Impatiens glandulifera]|uniref:uncharacterized protein LOC124913839 n=1 Tax=Impatiens glandulifera TaxID=253017 RepID=UPI001FB16EAD|nr:uncharacterized protein LOC124913839 [Impatiens glandulifera]